MENEGLDLKLREAYKAVFEEILQRYIKTGQTSTTSRIYIEFTQQVGNLLKVVHKVYPLRHPAVKEANDLINEYKLRFKRRK